MIGIILVAASQFFAELSTSLGKYVFEHNKESLLAMGFLSHFWTAVFFVIYGLAHGPFVFSLASLPTFVPRVILEIIITFVTLHAVLSADRSTFAFLRTLTIPLLLGVDMYLGYSVSFWSLLGIICMVISFLVLFMNHGLSPRGKFLTVLTALIAVVTISLYQYDIRHFNSVAAEQAIVCFFIFVTFAIAAWYHSRENVFAYLLHPVFFAQSIASGLSTGFVSFAYLFAPASIITSLKRAFEVFGSIVSGQIAFHERHLVVKMFALAFMTIGVFLTLIN